MKRQITISFSLCELEVLLLIFRPHELQELGKYANSAKAKLLKARGEMLAGRLDFEGEDAGK